jgi:hypothetical protein
VSGLGVKLQEYEGQLALLEKRMEEKEDQEKELREGKLREKEGGGRRGKVKKGKEEERRGRRCRALGSKSKSTRDNWLYWRRGWRTKRRSSEKVS